jgi:hypothetical protein
MKSTIKLKKKQSRKHNVRKYSLRKKSRKTKKLLHHGGNGATKVAQKAVQGFTKEFSKHIVPAGKMAVPAAAEFASTNIARSTMIPGNINSSFSNIPEKHRFVDIAQQFPSHPKNELEELLNKHKNHTGDDKYNTKFKTDFTNKKSPLANLEEQFKTHANDLIPEGNDELPHTYKANKPTVYETISKIFDNKLKPKYVREEPKYNLEIEDIDQMPVFSPDFDIHTFHKELIIDKAPIHEIKNSKDIDSYIADKKARINHMLPEKPNDKSLIKVLFKGLDPTFLNAIKNTLTFEFSHSNTGIFALLGNVYARKFGPEYTESLLIVLTPILDAVLNDIAEGALSEDEGGELGTISKALGIEMNSHNVLFKEMCSILNKPIREVVGIIHNVVKKDGFKISDINKELSSKENAEKLRKIKDDCVNTLGDKLLTVVATELKHTIEEMYQDIKHINVEMVENKLSGLKDKIKEKVGKAYDLFMDDTIRLQTIILQNSSVIEDEKTKIKKIKIGDFVMDENGNYTNDAWLNTTVKLLDIWMKEKKKNPDLPTVKFLLNNLDLSIPTLIDDLCNKLSGKNYCENQLKHSINEFKLSIQKAPERLFDKINHKFHFI